MKLLFKLLNKLSLFNYRDSSSNLAGAVSFLLLGLVFALCWMMSAKVERKLVFSIDEYLLGDTRTVTFGENSDFCVKNVPHDYLKITYDPEASVFRWSVNPMYRDTLQYFKINGDNPNKHVIRNDASQQISLRLPVSDSDTLSLTVSGADVWKVWKNFSDQKDVLARHLAAYIKLEEGKAAHEDSVRYLAQMQYGKVRSFFEHANDNIVLVILDELTTLSENGNILRYNREGVIPVSDREGRVKVQFFGIADWCYMDGNDDDGYFRVDGVNYVMKPSVKLTDWGAGHATVILSEEGLRLTYPKPITYVESVDSLRKRALSSSHILTIKQRNNSYPTKSDLYLPAFSNAINFDVANIEFFHQKDSICVRGNNDKAQLVNNPFSIIPALGKMTLHSGKDTLKCRVGYINGSFIFSYLWLPLCVFLVLMVLVWLKIGPVYVQDTNYLYNPQQIRHYRPYLTTLLVTCLAYCTCKSLIALKLSYSYPYFEKITGITPVSTSLMMLLFFSLAMLLNTPLRHYATKEFRLHRIWHWLVCFLMWGGLGWVFFKVMDNMVNQSVINSYFNEEVFNIRPWKWLEEYGINDTHRSVVYALLFIEGVVLVLWLAADCFWRPISNCWEKAQNFWNGVGEKMTRKLEEMWSRITKGLPMKIIMTATLLLLSVFVIFKVGFSWLLLIVLLAITALVYFLQFVRDAFIEALKSLFPSHFLLFVVLYAIGKVSGNFGTAFITLIVILGMTRALSSVKLYEGQLPRYTILCQMFFISLAYIAAAMVGDHGYMTNYLGFVMCFVCFFFLMERPMAYFNSQYQMARNEKGWVNGVLLVLVVLLVAMTFICSHLFSPEKVNYDRLARRVMLYSNFDDLERSGYRYSESDAEFMVILSHYMHPAEGSDPLSNDNHFLHTSVSSGQSPVVLNDMSMPAAFFGSYGVYLTSFTFFLLLFIVMWQVMMFSLSYYDSDARLTRAMQWRLLAMMMWVGTSFYIYLSYVGRLPFTGRLIPGYGVDAVGEALETAILLAFMAAVTCRENKTNEKWY
ncbi:MAG: hypothetical protein J6Y23_14690 [Prevotella sp.]|nr:hypothetical protein [Prevotella sp.]